MAPLKYERLIVKMSLEQKLTLITSGEFFKSSPVGSYEFPTFNITKDPYDESTKGVHVTQFPCDSALASSWNTELVTEVYAAIGAETRVQNPYAYFNCTNDLKKENIVDEYFVLGKFLAGKIDGLRRSNAYVNFEDAIPETEELALPMRGVRDEVLATAAPTSMIFNDVTTMDDSTHKFRYKDMIFGLVSTVEEALDYLYNGASFLFLKEDIFDTLLNQLKTLTTSYVTAHTKYVNDKMAESTFARLCRTFKIFDGEIIDRACDNIIDIVFSMKAAKDSPAEFKSLKKGENSTFDEINHSELARTAARQSAVLLKNDGKLLPLKHSLRVAVVGEYAKDIKYQRGYYHSRATQERLPFDAINDYEMNTVGYALGYAKGEIGRTDLIDHATSLANQADVVLLYLALDKGEDKLPPEQMELLNAISGRGAKIVAIVASTENPDMSFATKCSAVLLTYVSGQGGATAALDIITGEVCPSGKLAKSIGYQGATGYIKQYPAGYGLSYTTFAYDNLKVNESGVSFTVRNTGDFDGFAVPLMYVKKNNTKSGFVEKTMRGFTKVFVSKGDAVRVKIPFTEQTFSLYSEDKGYYVESGMYTVTVGENEKDEILAGSLLLKDYTEKNKFKNKIVQTITDGEAKGRTVSFSESDLPADVVAERKKLPFALRMCLALMLALYVDGILALFAFTDYILANKTLIAYAVIGAIALIVTVLVIVYICVIAHHRHAEKYLHPNVVLTEMLENVEEFAEIAKVKYKLPVEEEKEEEEEEEVTKDEDEEDEDEDEEPETQYTATYEVNFRESDSSDSIISAKVSFAELNRNLRDYLVHHGINLEASSARALTAAIISTKLVFLTSKNTELYPKFVKLLNEYYGNETLIRADDDWKSLSNLLWETGDGEGKFVLSAFSNAVYGAYKAKEQERVIVIDNVNLANLGSYFSHFLDYCNHPTEEYIISFNDDTSFRLPDNLTYVLAVQDGVLDGLPTEVLNASTVVDLLLTESNVPSDDEIVPKSMSHEDYILTLSEIKEAEFVTEKIWKKVDALAEAIGETEKFAIGNKNIIQMESFTSVMIDCGADEAEAVVGMFLSKLGYIIKNTRAYRQDGGEKTVYALIEKLFTEIELTKIKRLLNKPSRVRSSDVPETADDLPETDQASQATTATENNEQGAKAPENSEQAEQATQASARAPQPNAQPQSAPAQTANADGDTGAPTDNGAGAGGNTEGE